MPHEKTVTADDVAERQIADVLGQMSIEDLAEIVAEIEAHVANQRQDA